MAKRLSRVLRRDFTAMALWVCLCLGLGTGVSGLAVGAAHAQGDLLRIAAVVNDQAISDYEVAARAELIIVASDLPRTDETRQRLAPQVLRNLIDEVLQLQEAERLNLRATPRELEVALADIEQRNDMPPGGLQRMLEENGVPYEVMRRQIDAELTWEKLIVRRLLPEVEVGEEEVREAIEAVRAAAGETEYRVAELFVGIDTPDREAETRRSVERLVEELQRGANFSALARSFSERASAAVGGDLGWLRVGQMDPEVAEIVRRLRPGTISGVVRLAGGYAIYALIDQRTVALGNPMDARVEVRQVVVPEPTFATGEDPLAIIERIQDEVIRVGRCDAIGPALEPLGAMVGPASGEVRIGDMAAGLREALAQVPAGDVTEPFPTDDGGGTFFVVCRRIDPPSSLPSPEEVRENLERQRLDLLARRLLRDLRQAAYVDVRS